MNKYKEYNKCLYHYDANIKCTIPYHRFEHFVLKMSFLDIHLFNEKINADYVELELQHMNFLNGNTDITIIERLIKKYKIQRIVFNYSIDYLYDLHWSRDNFKIIAKLYEKTKLENLTVDFYFSNLAGEIVNHLKNFLLHYSMIKHFSVYFTEDSYLGIYVSPKVFAFFRYQKHMWSKNDYHSTFLFKSYLDKNYLYIGSGGVSRLGDKFFKCQLNPKIEGGWRLFPITTLDPYDIKKNDFLDRLSFYYPLTVFELWGAFIDIKEDYEYLMMVNNQNVYLVHDIIIENIIKKVYKFHRGPKN